MAIYSAVSYMYNNVIQGLASSYIAMLISKI
jgi:hypothetical protein